MNREMVTIPGTDISLGKRTYEIVSFVFDHPEMTYIAMAKELGVNPSRITRVMKHDKVLEAFPLLGRRAIKRMAPDAIKAYRDVIRQNDSMPAKEKASARALTELGIFDAPTVEIKNTYELKPTDELIRLIQQGKQAANLTSVDTEVIPDEDSGV